MTVRSLDILDLPFLSRYHQDVLALDTGRVLTRGNPLGVRAMLSYLNPNRQMHTAVASGEGGSRLMGQVLLKFNEPSARLTFLAPAGQINGMTFALLEELTHQAGEWGALHILAEVDEESPAYQVLRQAGFAMYAWQRAWKLPRLTGASGRSPWCPAQDDDWHAIQSLYGQIVPALLQPVEVPPGETQGLVCCPEGSLLAYTSVDSGAHGIWLQPLVPPDSACTPELWSGLMQAVEGTDRLPAYLCVRSYQAWLEPPLEEMGAEALPRQAILVKRLAVAIKEAQPVQSLEKAMAKIKPAAPVSRLVKPSGTDANHDL